jgi:competence protein ComEA
MRFVRLLLVAVAAISLALGAEAKAAKKTEAKTSQAPAAREAAKSDAAASKQAIIDINTASEKELKTLPGIGDAYAAKIVQNRPYRAKNQLVQKNIVPQATYDKIQDMIIAKQAPAEGKKK